MMNNVKKLLLPGLVGVAGFAGVAASTLYNSVGASAATNGTAATTTTSTAAKATDPAASAKAAAEAAVPGGTVERVENDAEGATYEAHVRKSDGSQVTVKMDASFKVTATEAGMGGGARPADTDTSSTTSN
jgi:uncharacterized cupredoxin-like copper-binding protein